MVMLRIRKMRRFWIRNITIAFLCLLFTNDISDYAASKGMGRYASFAAPNTIITKAYDINDAGQIVGNYSYHSGESHGFRYEQGIYTTIRCPRAWWMSTTPRGINNTGDIAGYYYNPDLKGEKGFLYSNGSYTTMVVPDSVSTSMNDINDARQIVGSYFDGSQSRGFLYSEGVYTTLSFPGAISTRATGINDVGQIVGSYFDGSQSRGFLYTVINAHYERMAI